MIGFDVTDTVCLFPNTATVATIVGPFLTFQCKDNFLLSWLNDFDKNFGKKLASRLLQINQAGF